jgi:hypothetical protein
MMLDLRKTNNGSNEDRLDAKGHYFGHMRASQLVTSVGYDRWREVFSFGFVRNPWERLVSVCSRINPRQLETPDTFTNWLLNDCPDESGHPHMVARATPMHIPCADFILPCTYVGRYETREADLERICAVIGRDVPEWRHEEKRTRERPYREYYTDTGHRWVRQHYWQDILTFGYSFEDGG